ncbi:hypothetical protein [Bradyrhizobium sp. 2TAF24]|uniref:hypothetical protein n=1 Tax=Bradyrhizobium sp. 2TAF24 TaxID=3233011 RepID=UPI003F8FB7E0
MSRWFDFLIGTEPAAAAVQATSSTVERSCPDRGLSEQIRDILRLELEIAAECALKRGSLAAATRLKELADTTRDVDMAALHAYARLLDDLGRAERTSHELRRVGVGWFPDNAADYVAGLVSRASAQAGAKAAPDPAPQAADSPRVRSAARSRP